MGAWVRVPQRMVEEHIRWHNTEGSPPGGGRGISMGEPGSGEEFLNWHADFFQRYLRWRRRKGLPPIRPWTRMPRAVASAGKIGADWNPPNVAAYPTLDAFGLAVESTVHWAMHEGAAIAYGEPILGTSASPLSLYFWRLLGLVDSWRRRWVAEHRRRGSSVTVVATC